MKPRSRLHRTAATVSMVFELLGATFAMAMLKMASADDGMGFADYMNTEKALSVIMAIFVSVAIAFVFGFLIQYVTRLLFSFSFKKNLKWKIGIFGGIALTAIVYFMLIKGAKDLSFMTPEVKGWINDNTGLLLLCFFIGFTVLMQVLYFCKVNVFKVIVLVGTFSLATAFAGNDLVNFIGVPLAGYSSYVDYMGAGGGNPTGHMMGALNEPASTPIIFLFCAGIVMVIALATSKKAHNVTKTEIGLSRQEEGDEMFGSSRVARSIVRWSNATAGKIIEITPARVRNWINSRFDETQIDKADGAALLHSNITYKAKDDGNGSDKAFNAIVSSRDNGEIWSLFSKYVAAHEADFLNRIAGRYLRVTNGLFSENVKVLRKTANELRQEKTTLKNLRRKETICLRHVDNHFSPIPRNYVDEFCVSRDKLKEVIEGMASACGEGRFNDLRNYDYTLPALQTEFSDLRKSLVGDIQNNNINLTVAYLYLNLIQESEQLAIELAQMSRAARKFQLG